MIDTFIRYLSYEKRYSHHTITSYHNDLKSFNDFISAFDPNLDLLTVDRNIVRAWIIHLVDHGISPRSVNRKISTLRSFYKFLKKRELITENPILHLNVLKTNKQLPGFVNEMDMLSVLQSANYSDDFVGVRDRLVLELLYGTGIRLSELIHLKHSDVNYFERQIRVLGKRNKERIIPFSKSLAEMLKDYQCKKNDLFESNEADNLIVTNKGDACYPMFIYRIVKKYLDQFTTLDKKSPHVLRHTFATHLLNKGADLNAVKELLGHANLAATQVYTHNSLDKLKAVFNQAHPKA